MTDISGSFLKTAPGHRPPRITGNRANSRPLIPLEWRAETGKMKEPHPLIIGVSISTIDCDRETKSRLYALNGLQEYWIVDSEQQCIEVRLQPLGDQFTKFQTFTRGQTISPLCLPSAKLDIDWLFQSASLA